MIAPIILIWHPPDVQKPTYSNLNYVINCIKDDEPLKGHNGFLDTSGGQKIIASPCQ